MCERWGQAGLLEWLKHLSAEKRERRDKTLIALEQHIPKQVCSWKVPDAGMFHWVTIRLDGASGLKSTKRNWRISCLKRPWIEVWRIAREVGFSLHHRKLKPGRGMFGYV
jgi:hypothetical protein